MRKTQTDLARQGGGTQLRKLYGSPAAGILLELFSPQPVSDASGLMFISYPIAKNMESGKTPKIPRGITPIRKRGLFEKNCLGLEGRRATRSVERVHCPDESVILAEPGSCRLSICGPGKDPEYSWPASAHQGAGCTQGEELLF
jgi:hypothetical protein